MTTADDEFAREYARLSAAFVAQLPQQVQILNDDLIAWLSASRETTLFDRLSHKLHQLRGSGSTFGCNGVSEAARVLEQRLAALRADAAAEPVSELDEVEAAMLELRGEANRIYRKSLQGGQPGTHT